MSKPVSIRKFDLFYLGSLVLSVVNTVLNLDLIKASARAQMGAEMEGMVTGIAMGSLALSVLLSLALWFLISKFRIELIKWVLILFLAWTAITLPDAMSDGISLAEILAIVSAIMQAVAIWFLFRPDAKAWFAAKNGGGGDAGGSCE